MSIRVAREFQGRWEVFWATTYSLEVELFEEYLLRRLGEAPLNATVLADFYRLSRLWEAHADDELRRLHKANRDYLIRGVTPGGAFHPKTYFFGNRSDGVLLVGSGNLTLRGIEEGHEVFVRFESSNERDLSSIRGWRDWMDVVVQGLDDREVTYRWLDLKQRTPWLEGPADGSLVVSNVASPLLDQLAEGTATSADELHVLAPYFDREAHALEALLTRFVPKRLTLYLGRGTSVHGPALLSLLERHAPAASVLEFDPSEFVHAKLIGLVFGDAGRLLSGSANLSQAALLATAGKERWANLEAGVLLDTSADVVRAVFESGKLALRAASLANVAELAFEPDEEAPRPPLALRAARMLPDQRLEVDYEGETAHPLFVSNGREQQELLERRTIAAFALDEGTSFVWLSDEHGAELSNKVPLDDSGRLRGWLEERTGAADRPGELEARDFETPVGRMLLYLHDRCIFDIDETAAAARASRLANEEAGESDASWDFLEQLLKEELRFDHRAERYQFLSETGLPVDDDVLALLQLMLERTPEEVRLRLLGNPAREEGNGEKEPGEPWSPERRLQVRLFNVLERWSRALGDPRYAWIDPLAPLRNYLALLPAVTECWEQTYLPEHRIIHLASTLFSSFLGSERANGYLLALDEAERQRALRALPMEARLLGGGVVYAALRPTGPWRDFLFEWQPFVTAGLELDVFEVAAATSTLVERLVGEEVSPNEIEERLIWAGDYIDDEHWCLKQQRDLDLPRVVLTKEGFNPRYGITVAVKGVERGIDDPRLVPLVRQALEYRKVEGAIVEVGSTRLSVLLGESAWARVNGREYQSRFPITTERLRDCEQRGLSWGSILLAAGSAAS